MFTIKVVRKGGYTAYCCEIYAVVYEDDGNQITLHITPSEEKHNTYPVSLYRKRDKGTTVYIENPHGKTIDTLKL
jgi:hypothetical protein